MPRGEYAFPPDPIRRRRVRTAPPPVGGAVVTTLWNCGTVRQAFWVIDLDTHIQAIMTVLEPVADRRNENEMDVVLQSLVDFCREQADPGYADQIRNHPGFMYVATVHHRLQEMRDKLSVVRTAIDTLPTENVTLVWKTLGNDLATRVAKASTWRSSSEDTQDVLTLLSGGLQTATTA